MESIVEEKYIAGVIEICGTQEADETEVGMVDIG